MVEQLKRIDSIPNHNWQDFGRNKYICKDCEAEKEYKNGAILYMPGNGNCDV